MSELRFTADHEWLRLDNDGLVTVGITHYAHGYQHRQGASGGLFPAGRALLKEMASLGMVLDVSHASEDSMRESLEIFSGPVLASHHNCRALVPGPRQISDEQIKMIVERGAVIGHMMSANALYNEERHGLLDARTKRELTSLNDFVDHVDHVCQIAGNSLHSGLGTDLDGAFGKEQTPQEDHLPSPPRLTRGQFRGRRPIFQGSRKREGRLQGDGPR